MRQWVFTFPSPPLAFSLDPSEDILLVWRNWRFLFLSLSSREPHPLVADFTLSDRTNSLHQSVHILPLLVAGNYVAALLSTYQRRPLIGRLVKPCSCAQESP